MKKNNFRWLKKQIKRYQRSIKNKNIFTYVMNVRYRNYIESYQKSLYDRYNNFLAYRSGCFTSNPPRIVDDCFLVETHYDVGFVDRDTDCFDDTRDFLSCLSQKQFGYYLWCEESKDWFIDEHAVACFNSFHAAVQWVNRHGCPDYDKCQYYIESDLFIYRVWNTTHLTKPACRQLLNNIFSDIDKENEEKKVYLNLNDTEPRKELKVYLNLNDAEPRKELKIEEVEKEVSKIKKGFESLKDIHITGSGIAVCKDKDWLTKILGNNGNQTI